jgi:hypothetical protein
MKRTFRPDERTCADGALSFKMMALMSGLFGVVALTLPGADPGWWSSRGAVNSNPTNDYAYINEGQLKQFTARAVDEMNADLTNNGGAGPALTSLVSGWHADYAAHGQSTNDFLLMNVGQLKTIGGMVYGQLASAGYPGLYPSWLHQNTNSDNAYANIGQLKTVFNFDLTVAPAPVTNLVASNSNPNEIDLFWTLPAMNNGQLILIEQSADDGTTWTTDATIDDPTTTTYADTDVTDGDNLDFRVTLSNTIGSSVPTATPTPIAAKPPPQYAIIDLGAGLQPQKITNSGYVLSSIYTPFPVTNTGYISSYRWFNGTNSLLLPADSGTYAYAYDIAEDGTTVGEEASSLLSPISELIWSPTSTTPLELTDPNPIAGPAYFALMAGVAINGLDDSIWSLESFDPSNDAPLYDDGFHGTAELGTVTSFSDGFMSFGMTGNLVAPEMANKQGDWISLVVAYTGSVDASSFTFDYNAKGSTSGQPVGFTPSCISNEIPQTNGQPFVLAVGYGFDANYNFVSYYWDGRDGLPHQFDNGGGAACVNAASVVINGQIEPAVQIANGPYVYSMNPATGQIGSPVDLNTLIPSNQNWSAFNVGYINSPGGGNPGAFNYAPGAGGYGVSHAINDYGAIVGTATYSADSSSHGVLLLPVVISQNNYPTPSTADSTTDSGQTFATTKIINGSDANGIAYITGAPYSMPLLTAKINGLDTSGMTVDWRLTVTSERPERGTKDNYSIPPTGGSSNVINVPINQAWDITEYCVPPADSFGGNVTLYYRIKKSDGTYLMSAEQNMSFKIRGKNPLDTTAKSYIQSLEGIYWYAWAIAQHESRQTISGADRVYNQFNAGGSQAELPNYSADGYDGWGIFQRDDTGGGIYVTTEQVYDWIENTSVALTELNSKQSTQQRFFSAVAAAYTNDAEAQTPPASYPAYTGSSTTMTALDMGTITLYNGAAGCPTSTIGGTTYQNPWTFNENGQSGHKWQYTPNANNYLYKVIHDEYEGHLPYSE